MNALYTTYKNVHWGATTYALPSLIADTIKAVMCDATYTVNLASHVYLSDVTSGARIATQTVSGITIVSGAVDVSSTITFASVTTGKTLTHMVFYKDTGSAATSPLLAHFDTFASGMPINTNGTNVDVTVDAAGLFTL